MFNAPYDHAAYAIAEVVKQLGLHTDHVLPSSYVYWIILVPRLKTERKVILLCSSVETN